LSLPKSFHAPEWPRNLPLRFVKLNNADPFIQISLEHALEPAARQPIPRSFKFHTKKKKKEKIPCPPPAFPGLLATSRVLPNIPSSSYVFFRKLRQHPTQPSHPNPSEKPKHDPLVAPTASSDDQDYLCI